MKRSLKIVGAFVALVCIFVGAIMLYEEGVSTRGTGDVLVVALGAILCAAGVTYFWAVRRDYASRMPFLAASESRFSHYPKPSTFGIWRSTKMPSNLS